MTSFDIFLNQGDVKKITPDLELTKSLIKDMDERLVKSNLLDINIFPKIIFENIYDSLRDFCDALLAKDGFKSYSHQASISYLIKQGFDLPTVKELDQFRYKRNGSKYYGVPVSVDEAKEIKEFYEEIKDHINKIIIKLNLK